MVAIFRNFWAREITHHLIDSIDSVPVVSKICEENLLFDLKTLPTSLLVASRYSNTKDESENQIISGSLTLWADKPPSFEAFSNLPRLRASFNGEDLFNWDYARRKFVWVDFLHRPLGNGSFDSEWGRTTSLLYKLNKSGDRLRFLSIARINKNQDASNNWQAAQIYAAIPPYGLLLQELKFRKILK